MIVARTLASAARSCIQRCRQSRGGDLHCACNMPAGPGAVVSSPALGEACVMVCHPLEASAQRYRSGK
jgi:hypothetical protein